MLTHAESVGTEHRALAHLLASTEPRADARGEPSGRGILTTQGALQRSRVLTHTESGGNSPIAGGVIVLQRSRVLTHTERSTTIYSRPFYTALQRSRVLTHTERRLSDRRMARCWPLQRSRVLTHTERWINRASAAIRAQLQRSRVLTHTERPHGSGDSPVIARASTEPRADAHGE